MTAHSHDQWVQKMAKYILGTDDFEGRFSRARGKIWKESMSMNLNKFWYNNLGVFGDVMGYQKEPLPFQPQDQGWTSSERNVDLVSDKQAQYPVFICLWAPISQISCLVEGKSGGIL